MTPVGVPWEVGLFAHDLDASVHGLSKQLDLTFREIMTARVPSIEDPEPTDLEFRFTMSFEGPPYVEIIEAVEGSNLHSPDLPDGLHHLGVWVTDLDAHHRRLSSQGVRSATRAYMDAPDGSHRLVTWFNDPRDLEGVRYEFLDDQFRPLIDEWLVSPAGTPHPLG